MDFLTTTIELRGDPTNILGMLGIAILTVMIPVAITILNEKDFEVLDRHVALDQVINRRSFAGSIACIYVPLIIWAFIPGNCAWLLIVFLAFWLYGIFKLLRTVNDLYKWLKRDRYQFRLDYLKNHRVTDDTVESWKSVWNKDNLPKEYDFISIFSGTIGSSVSTENPDYRVRQLLIDFSDSISKRSLSNLIVYKLNNGKCFNEMCLEWHFAAWNRGSNALNAIELNNWSFLSYDIRKIISRIQLQSADSPLLFTPEFMRQFDCHQSHVVTSANQSSQYADLISRLLIKNLFDIVSS